MSRTERDSVCSADPLAGTQFLDADPSPEDFQVYRHLVDSFPEQMRYEALPYWSSVPLPAQSLGPRYAAWKRAKIKAAPNLMRMTRERRNRLSAPTTWPDAKLRALSSVAPPKLLSLPWVAPSLPWWPLGGGWKSLVADPKVLMFSRFRATPPSVAALLSFGVEAQCLPKDHGGYEKAYRRRRFKLAAVPGPVMAAFHPSPWVIRTTNPLMKAGATLSAVRKDVRRQILAALPKGIVERNTVKARRRHRSIARILASIERTAGIADQSAIAWNSAIGDDRAAQSTVRKWRQAQPIDRLSPAELSDLVDYAIGAPGVALGRALRRHDPTILDPARYPELVQLSWQGLRAYLDNPVILSSLPGNARSTKLWARWSMAASKASSTSIFGFARKISRAAALVLSMICNHRWGCAPASTTGARRGTGSLALSQILSLGFCDAHGRVANVRGSRFPYEGDVRHQYFRQGVAPGGLSQGPCVRDCADGP
jgi:hypothetical protein